MRWVHKMQENIGMRNNSSFNCIDVCLSSILGVCCEEAGHKHFPTFENN